MLAIIVQTPGRVCHEFRYADAAQRRAQASKVTGGKAIMQVNPDPAAENFQFNPIERVTGLFDVHDNVAAAVAALQAQGVAQPDIAVFAGHEGARALDATGESHGTVARLFRVVESWVSDTSDFHALAEAHLEAGGYVVAARVGADDLLKSRVMRVMRDSGAREVKFWHSLFVEQGSSDVE